MEQRPERKLRVPEIDSWFSVTKIGRAGGYARTQKAMYPCTYVLEIQKVPPNCKKIALRAAFGQVHRYIEISKIARAGTHGYIEQRINFGYPKQPVAPSKLTHFPFATKQ